MNASENTGALATATALAVDRELICLLFDSPAVPLLNGIVVVATARVLWRVFPIAISASWTVTSLSIVLLRLLLWSRFNHAAGEMQHPRRWGRLFTMTTVLLGCAWGLTSATIFVAQAPIDYFFTAFVVAGLSAVAAIRTSPHPSAFYGFVGTAALPLVVALFVHGQPVSMAMGCLVVTFLAMTTLVGRQNYLRLGDSIRMKVEQDHLNTNLQQLTLDLTQQNAVLSERTELLDNAQDAIYVLDRSTSVLYWNMGAERMFGWSEKEVLGRELGDVFPESREHIRIACKQTSEHGRWSGEISKRDKSGNELTVASRCTRVEIPGTQPRSIFVINTDVTEQKVSRARIHRLAYFDEVTGLPNRMLLRERLQKALQTSRVSGLTGALFFIDMDDFKTLNDTAGHEVGDLLLEQIAARLTSVVRSTDCVARLGGDEFVVLVEDLGTDQEASGRRAQFVGRQILVALRQMYHLNDYDYQCTASIGVTLIGDDPDELDDLLKRADMAMYRSKEQGRNRVCVFDPAMERELAARAALITDVHRALACHEFELFYQPQLDSQGRVIGCEALSRWRHPVRGLIAPAEFIPVAESGGMILELGARALLEVCRRLAMWQDQPGLNEISIAVNVSCRQFADPHFVRVVRSALHKSGANPSRLTLEITESAAMDNVSEAIVKMMTLKALGIQISLDDFGTGYSSLSQLKLLPLDQLKIDKSFVQDIVTSVLDASIVKTIIDLGRNLNLDVIAEGIEAVEQLQFLKAHGCPTFQGFLYSRPLPVVAFEAYALEIQGPNAERTPRQTIPRHGKPTLPPVSCAIRDPWLSESISATEEAPALQ
jgi:diguanylate cyclase (GGDEF)-like protein/PAS domain S-box-containing protein